MTSKRVLHLVCNAHIDPVWQWEWEEGVSETIATFRTAAELCEEFDGFIFNHNESILYQWVEAYDPGLFKRIQHLVQEGKWHIMGGWYLQPDCNMPSGESLVRQILTGLEYFKKKFNCRPQTAINFDPFGHSRGLVQILVKSGYDSYIHCRPTAEQISLKEETYLWKGYDGSEIICIRPKLWYNSPLGEAGEKLKKQLKHLSSTGVTMMLWGVGNHGGGPSRKDIRDLNTIIEAADDVEIRHSTPEACIENLKTHKAEFCRWQNDLNPWAVGCYTSMASVKQGYRTLESELFLTEKMASIAAFQALMPYPEADLKEAGQDLLWTAFHDVLPGSATAPVETHTLNKIGHGMEILSRIKAKAFFLLTSGQSKTKPGTFPILVFNPHPYEIEATLLAEFNLPDFVTSPDTFYIPSLRHEGMNIPIQAERPDSNMPVDWRKRVCFQTRLKPGVMNRFDITLTRVEKRPILPDLTQNKQLVFQSDCIDWAINTDRGWIDRLQIHGQPLLQAKAFRAIVMQDTPDPWGMTTTTFDEELGCFELMSPEKSAQISGVIGQSLNPIRVVEDGPVRTLVEALYEFNNSVLIMTWKLPKKGTEIELEIRVFWQEKDKLLKLAVPSLLADSRYTGEVVYGNDILAATGREVVAQKWTAIVSEEDNLMFTCINHSTYGSSFKNGEMRLSLLRSPAYTAHPEKDWAIVPDHQFRPRIDQGERIFTFWFNAGPIEERRAAIAREAQTHHENPMVQWFSPSGTGTKPTSLLLLSNNQIQMTALKRAESGKGWIVRLFEPTGQKQQTLLRICTAEPYEITLTFTPFEIKTFRVDTESIGCEETDLMENNL